MTNELVTDHSDLALNKTTRMNVLIDLYENLLTEKQRTYLHDYYHDNYSLAEIAEQYEISRQAVYEHLKRAEQSLEAYELKLQLAAADRSRQHVMNELDSWMRKASLPAEERIALSEIVDRLKQID